MSAQLQCSLRDERTGLLKAAAGQRAERGNQILPAKGEIACDEIRKWGTEIESPSQDSCCPNLAFQSMIGGGRRSATPGFGKCRLIRLEHVTLSTS